MHRQSVCTMPTFNRCSIVQTTYLVVEAIEVSELHHLRAGVDARGEQLGFNRRHANLA